jgi:phospholipid transport system substrate-binding protein
MKTFSAFALAILLLMQPVFADAGVAADQLRQTIDQVLAILKDPQLKGDRKKNERREKLRQVLSRRFDFTEMAKRSLGSHWRRLTAEQQKEFVKLFTRLLEDAYLDKIESYNGEKVQFLKERQDDTYAEVETKIIDNSGQAFSVDYRLHNVNGNWQVYDVIIEDISLVNNYRSQFNRVLSRSSYEELLERMRERKLSAPGTKNNVSVTHIA